MPSRVKHLFCHRTQTQRGYCVCLCVGIYLHLYVCMCECVCVCLCVHRSLCMFVCALAPHQKRDNSIKKKPQSSQWRSHSQNTPLFPPHLCPQERRQRPFPHALNITLLPSARPLPAQQHNNHQFCQLAS